MPWSAQLSAAWQWVGEVPGGSNPEKDGLPGTSPRGAHRSNGCVPAHVAGDKSKLGDPSFVGAGWRPTSDPAALVIL
jgi:hypothetical protein